MYANSKNNNEAIRITELAKLNNDEREENMIYLSEIPEPIQVTERARLTHQREQRIERSFSPKKSTPSPRKKQLSLQKKREKAHNLLWKVIPLFTVALVMLIVSLVATLKITWVGLELWGISFDIVSMNDDSEIHHWNEHIQEIYEEDIAKRNALINSEDDLVSFVARHSNLVRFPMWICSIMMLLMSFYSTKVLLPKVVRPAYFLFKTRKK